LEPKPSQVHAEDIIAALPLIPCFTGQQEADRHEFAYSVAQHCILVSHLVEPKLALGALLHDAWKVYVSDLTRPLNILLNQISNGEWHRVRTRIQEVVALKFGTPFPLPHAIEHGDMIARATELRDVMAPPPEDWGLKLPAPDNEIIVPLHPAIVRNRFRQRWLAL